MIIKPAGLSKEELEDQLLKAKQIFQPWLSGARLIAQKTRDEDAEIFVKVLENSIYVTPYITPDSDNSEQFGLTHLNDVPETNRPFLRILAIPHNYQPKSPHWQNYIQQINRFSATYIDELDMLTVKEATQPNLLLCGLVIHHEVQHGLQDAMQNPENLKYPYYLQRREIDAYEYEFRLMDNLNNQHLNEMVSEHKYNASKKHFTLNPDDPRLDKVFGQMNSNERLLAAGLIMLRGSFLYAESLPKPEEMKFKIQVMMAQGYR